MNENRKNVEDWIDYVYVEWLGKWEKPNIRPSILKLILKLRSAADNPQKLDDGWRLIEGLEKEYGILHDETKTHLKEPAQMLLECGLAADRMGDSLEGIRFFQRAIGVYTDPHDLAVARWLLGCLYWHFDDAINAISVWEQTLDGFRDLETRTLKISERTAWYHEKVDEICDILTLAADNHTLPPIPPVKRPPQIKVADLFGSLPIIDQIPTRTTLRVLGGGIDLIRTTRVWLDSKQFKIVSLLPNENPISLLMGQRLYILKVHGNSMNKADPQPILDKDYVIVRQQRTAQCNDIVVTEITDGRHRDAHATLKRFVRLGEKIYLVPESTDPKYTQQLEFLDCFIEFGEGFHIHGVALGLLKLVPEPLPAHDTIITQHPEPSTPQASTSGEIENRYQYLCTLVGGERDVAEGLIDYEREKKPNANQDELIERAIERLLRDRR